MKHSYERFFSFGCSYTRWLWPTWSDIIKYDLSIPTQNWGIPGIGNVAINHKILECDIKNKFTKNDLIIIGWSGWTREDRYAKDAPPHLLPYKGPRWLNYGNIFTGNHYNKYFRKHLWSEYNDYMKNMTAIIYTNKVFDINYQFHIFDYMKHRHELGTNLKSVGVDGQVTIDLELFRHLFHNLIINMPEKHVFDKETHCKKKTSFSGKVPWDPHPDILGHLKYTKTIYNNLNLKLKETTIDYFTNLHDDIVKSIHKPLENYDQIKTFFVKYFGYDLTGKNKYGM